MHIAIWGLLPFAGLMPGPASPSAADRSPARVIDQAWLFRPGWIVHTEGLIREIRQAYHFDVRIETMASLPEADRKKFDAISGRSAKGRYFAQMARAEAEKVGVEGLYVLICMNPRYIQVVVNPVSLESEFPRFDQRQLHDFLAKRIDGARVGQRVQSQNSARAAVGFGWRFRPATGPDAALLDAVAQINSTLRAHAADPNAVDPLPVVILLSGGVACWLLLSLVQNRMARRAASATPSETKLPDRTPAILASQFGTPAAYWLYDRLFFDSSAAVRSRAPAPAAKTLLDAPSDGDAAPVDEFVRQGDPVDSITGDDPG